MTIDDPTHTIEELIQLARSGDEVALGKILANHRDWLKLAAEKKLDEKLAARMDASDIVQMTLLSACRQIEHFQGSTTAEFIAWIGKIQEHNIQDAIRQHVRSQKRSVHRERNWDQTNELEDRDSSTPSQKIIKTERIKDLAGAIESLPEDQREVVRLRHLKGYSLEQMAQHFGRSKEAVASLLKRGIETLRTRIQDR